MERKMQQLSQKKDPQEYPMDHSDHKGEATLEEPPIK